MIDMILIGARQVARDRRAVKCRNSSSVVCAVALRL